MGSISGLGGRANLTFQDPTKSELCALGYPLYHTIVYQFALKAGPGSANYCPVA